MRWATLAKKLTNYCKARWAASYDINHVLPWLMWQKQEVQQPHRRYQAFPRGEVSMWIMESILEEKNWMITGILFQEIIFNNQLSVATWRFGTINNTLIEESESVTIFKSQGKLEQNTELKRNFSETFILIMTVLISEYGQEQFHNIKLNTTKLWICLRGITLSMFKTWLIATKVILLKESWILCSFWIWIYQCNSRLLIESRLYKTSRSKLQVSFGHLKEIDVVL